LKLQIYQILHLNHTLTKESQQPNIELNAEIAPPHLIEPFNGNTIFFTDKSKRCVTFRWEKRITDHHESEWSQIFSL